MTGPRRVRLGGSLYRPVVPPAAVRVVRPGRYGNPHRVAPGDDPRPAIAAYRDDLLAGRLRVSVEDVRRDLAGRDLACWCPVGQPCHGDVLLEVANSAPEPT